MVFHARVSEEYIYGCPKFRGTLEYRWGKLNFKGPSVNTDLLLYKERSYLILPSEGEENRFFVSADESGVDFFIASSSVRNFQAMRGFFTKMYDCYASEEEPERIQSGGRFVMTNRNIMKKSAFSYFPEFLRNMIYLPSSVEDLKLQYEVIIRSSHNFRKRKLYNFCVYVRFETEGWNPDEMMVYVRNEVARLNSERKWKMGISTKGRVRFRTDKFDDPMKLCNFVRIPIDEKA